MLLRSLFFVFVCIPFLALSQNTFPSSGNVGIGTTSPSFRLELANLGGYNGILFDSKFKMRTSSATSGHFVLENITSNGSLYLRGGKQGGALVLNDINDGNVGIGTTNPDSKLSVKGNIHAREVKVDMNGAVAPDYVFDINYKLLTLQEVQDFINKNGHLPNVPSAKQMDEEGLHLKEMNLKLLEKIEEITLYVLKQEQRIKILEDQLSK
ncbi:tail fiber protein [Zunongwangia pacifica]|nr:tail fiber protein [Zunongwangia pacifica]